MLRISAGVSLCFTLLAIGGAVGGCSSESAEGGKGGSSAAGTSAAGTSAAGTSAGGTSASSGGTSSGRAGSSGSGTVGNCTPGEVICLDDATAQACDEVTGEPLIVNCAEDLKEIGFDSTGCDAAEGLCNSEPTDPVCWDGATVFAICGQLTSDQYLNLYVNCWQDLNDARPLVRCLAPFLATSGIEADCAGAEAECAQYAGGAGGTGGTGGTAAGEAGAGG